MVLRQARLGGAAGDIGRAATTVAVRSMTWFGRGGSANIVPRGGAAGKVRRMTGSPPVVVMMLCRWQW
jgi:hypothetical protein